MAIKSDTDLISDSSRPSNHNYLSSNFFRLSISRAPTVAYMAQQVGIPSLSLQDIIQPTTLSTQVSIPGNLFQFLPLTVAFLLDEEMRSWKEIFDWMTSIANYKSTANRVEYQNSTSDISLTLTNSAYKDKYKIIFRRCHPVSLAEIPLSIQNTDNVPLTGRVSFKYTYFDFETLT